VRDEAQPSQARGENIDVMYVGSVGGMEEGIVAEESTLPFRAIKAAALRGRGPAALVRNTLTLQAGVWQAHALLRELRPAAILGTGGYVCVPLFVAARMVGVPTMIYLPDIVPGLAVRFLSRIATRVACSFEPSLRYLPRAKTVVTGYPLRPSVGHLDRATSRATFNLRSTLPVLLVYGGSRGSRSINRAIERLMKPLLEICEIIHVCGREGDEVFLAEAASQLPAVLRERYHLHAYLTGTMPEALTAADVTVCRSGASTLAELPAVGLPAVLVPLSSVHQDENADYLTERGAALTVADDAMLGAGPAVEGPLFQAVQRLLLDREARAAMATHSRTLARPEAAERLAAELLMLAR
jgi:UDP-N-acetylglucosamine--N-acetylmuramyl-(pentapeptide) pyrophosphoryl-undecaprenol N-acetylglucosamine transferase